MTKLALVLYCVFLVVTFVWRPWMQYRRTGDHGFRGFSGEVSPLERLSGVLFAAALIAFLGAGIVALNGITITVDLGAWAWILGLVLALTGFGVVLAAQSTMGSSWRVGVDPAESTELVTDGLFGIVRNPVFSAIGIFAVGFSLLVPNALSVTALVLGAIGIELQVRRVEEPYLLRTHGAAYGEYASSVGRFVPGVGRLP
jgi:protein-S-isoprenylcysteine O-methyltransferase Ste14